MHRLKYLSILFLFFVMINSTHSQGVFSPEIGIMAGPTQFRSDFGERENSDTNIGNSGFGVGVMGYLNFSYRRNYRYYRRSTYAKEHFKIRGEMSYANTKLDHHGEWVKPERTSDSADRLRGHKGSTQTFNVGFQIEYSPLGIRGLESFAPSFSPFLSLGLLYTYYTAKVSTNYANDDPLLNGNVSEPTNFYPLWKPGSVKQDTGAVPALVGGAGVRYKLNKMNDLMLELRGTYFFSDWVDGLNHQLPSNKTNDYLVWLNIGYIAYFD